MPETNLTRQITKAQEIDFTNQFGNNMGHHMTCHGILNTVSPIQFSKYHSEQAIHQKASENDNSVQFTECNQRCGQMSCRRSTSQM